MIHDDSFIEFTILFRVDIHIAQRQLVVDMQHWMVHSISLESVSVNFICKVAIESFKNFVKWLTSVDLPASYQHWSIKAWPLRTRY